MEYLQKKHLPAECEQDGVHCWSWNKRAQCTVCDTPFHAGRGDAEYCSGACKQKAYRDRKRVDRQLAERG